VPPVHNRPATPDAAPRPPASGRNVAAGVLALVAVLLVFVGTFLPIIQFDFGGANGSTDGWGEGINDGPIHSVVLLIPLVMGILSLLNRARIVVKVLLILSSLIGFFWVAIRFADVSGSFSKEDAIQDFVARAADPGVGLYLILSGWVLVLVAGIVAKAGTPRVATPTYGAPYGQPCGQPVT
jgi:hypothetical protein